MKKIISATIDSDTEKIIEKVMKTGKFRNKSHVVEEAIRLLGEKNGK